jgi:hypothetical protein
MAEHLARRGSARHESPALPFGERESGTQPCAGLLTTSTSAEASMSPSFSPPISPFRVRRPVDLEPISSLA